MMQFSLVSLGFPIDKISVKFVELAEVQQILSPAAMVVSRGLISDHLVHS